MTRTDDLAPLAPGASIGILGGGQLGRMLALAAAPLGYRCHIYGPEADAPASQVAAAATVAAYDDEDALARFARAVDVVTYEFENVPLAAADTVAAIRPVRPGREALRTAQDRLVEKRRDGKSIFYSLASSEARIIIETLYELYCKRVSPKSS